MTTIVPADTPAYVVDDSGVVLLGEFSRIVTVECAACQCGWRLKLIADDVLSDTQCDEQLDSHLRERGWIIGDDDVCPTCAA